ncbi:MAG: hypothetical protein JST19_01255 [Bacteroidetes bacterium]|nr:hypothetical protein [Bacteroidota bacterium]
MKIVLRKSHKRSLIVTCTIIALVLILSFLVNKYWSPILAKEVRKIVLKSSDSLYTIDFSDAKLHVVRGEIDFYNITLKPDTAVYNRRRQQHLAPNNLVEIRVKRLVLSHIHPFKLYFQHKLEIGRIALKEPEMHISYALNHSKDTTTQDKRTIWQKISKSLKSIHIGEIVFSDIKLKYDDYSGNRLAISELKELNINVTDLLIDSATQKDRSRLLYCKNIDAELNNFSGRSANGLYNYKIGSMKLSTQASQVNITGLDLEPVKAEVFFDKSYHDRFKIHLDSLQLNHFDYLGYHKYRIVNARSMNLGTGNVAIFGNPRQSPNKNADRVKSFPHFALRQVNANITVDTIYAHHVDVLYTEFNSKSKQTGVVKFINTEGLITNVTTNRDSLKKNHFCIARLTSHFMGSGKLDATLTFNLTDPDASFSYKGSVGPMDLQLVNPACMPLALIKLNSGTVKQMDFNINANARTAHGAVSVLYNDLKVTVLKADTVNDRLKHTLFASLFANLLVIKHDNPDKPGGKPRVAIVDYNRPPGVPFWGSIWQTLFAGIKPCAGVDKKMQQDIKVRMEASVLKKQQRQVKKTERKQRRQERRMRRELKQELKKQDTLQR